MRVAERESERDRDRDGERDRDTTVVDLGFSADIIPFSVFTSIL